jgi:hypothetical protein
MLLSNMSIEEFKHLIMGYLGINYPTCTGTFGDDLVIHLVLPDGRTIRSQSLTFSYDKFHNKEFKDSAECLNRIIDDLDAELISAGLEVGGGRF